MTIVDPPGIEPEAFFWFILSSVGYLIFFRADVTTFVVCMRVVPWFA